MPKKKTPFLTRYSKKVAEGMKKGSKGGHFASQAKQIQELGLGIKKKKKKKK